MKNLRRLRLPLLATALCTLLLGACGGSSPETDTSPLQVWPLPAAGGSAQPDISVSHDGRVLVSWLRQQADGRTAFQYGEYGRDGVWSPARTIAVGSRFFVNWADTPHVLATPDGAIWAQWLQKVGEADAGAYSYHVILSTSRDGGVNWSDPARVHADESLSEHGFVSMWPASAQQLGIAWLDGGAMGSHGEGEHGPSGGRMQLHASVMEPGLLRANETGEQLLDASTCECCPTDAALSARGPVVVYRGRSDDEIRDIRLSRFEQGSWSTPVTVHADDWRIEGCPVNGPAVAAAGNNVLVGWFTGAADTPAVKLARSIDAGESFGEPLQVDVGGQVLGRVDAALDEHNAWLLWLRQDGEQQGLWLARFQPDLSAEIERVQIATINGNSRASGIPKLAVRDGNAFVVWTDLVDGSSQVRGARYRPQAAVAAH